jgi:hypothetical protein
MNIQMIPGAGCKNPCPVNGRSYTGAVGAVIAVPDFDASGLEANGWLRCASNGAGATATRPTVGVFKGFEFYDSTVGANIIWDGAAWRNHSTGASA